MLGRDSMASAPVATSSDAAFQPSPFAPSQAKIPLDSLLLSGDQQTSAHVTTWDTPFTVLDSNVASAGLVLTVREPRPGQSWTQYVRNLQGAAVADVASTFDDATLSTATVDQGRTPNLIESWGAGAPAWFGSTQQGKVALHWHGVLRPVAGRSWFSTDPAPTFSLALGGNGFVRITKTVAGVTSEVLINGQAGLELTETDFLTNGLVWTEVLASLNAGDALDIYYVQNGELWGGLVAKVVSGSTQTATLAQDAAVLGCGLFDDGTPPAALALGSWKQIQITQDLTSAATAEIQVPLLNPMEHDGFGYEWRRDTDGDDPGRLYYWDAGTVQGSLRRGQLLQITGGLAGEEYVLFTGFVDDFEPPRGDGVATIRCLGFERRAIKDTVRNEPDELSYMAFGYHNLLGTTEPVYGIPAYDNWAIEHAIQDVLYRAGFDGSRLLVPWTATMYDGSSATISYNGETFLKFRARSLLGNKLRCERSVHYGNVGYAYDDYKPADDQYVFKPDDSKEPWSRVRELADRYGYDCRCDHKGDVVLRTRANASTVVDVDGTLTSGTGTQQTHPSAFKGTYWQFSGAEAGSVSFTFTGSRVDVSLPRGPGFGNWEYMRVVRTSDDYEVARVSNIDGTNDTDVYYYDYRTTADGKNATVVTLYSGAYDTYRVDCVGNSSGADGLQRRIDTFFVYGVDPLMPLYPRPLTTAENALSVNGGTSADEQRNLVYVVGKRKAAVTDSEKLRTNPNNPEPEFIVEVAVDTGSITDPAAKNYQGARHAAAIFDPSITDPDYAAYLARTFVYRYRTPQSPADIDHTILPVLELRDPLRAVEATFQSVNEAFVLWATRFTHTFEASGRAHTQITTSPWPEFPSYELREDIDIDVNFNGVPVANVAVSYTSLTGQTLTNMAAANIVHESGPEDLVQYYLPVTAGTPEVLDLTGCDWPPIPGTLMLSSGAPSGAATTVLYPSTVSVGATTTATSNLYAGSMGATLPGIVIADAASITTVVVTAWRDIGSGNSSIDQRWTASNDPLASTPFLWEWEPEQRLLTVYWKSGGTPPTTKWAFSVLVTYEKVDAGMHGDWLADNPYHHFTNIDYRDSNRKVYLPWVQGDSTANYQRPTNVTHYTVQYRRLGPTSSGVFSDPYNGVSPFADPTTTELGYLATVTLDALVTGYYRVSVRSVHDDTIVAYLTEPTGDPQQPEAHWEYLTAGPARSWEWDYIDQLGAWNKRQSEQYSAALQGQFELSEKEPIGDGFYVWNRERDHSKLGPLALISGERDARGTPVFGQGTYAAWYVMIEVMNDHLEEVHVSDPTKAYPRVVKTSEPVGSEVAPTYTTDGATSAVIYTHLPEPSMAELTIQDWVSATAYDPTDSTAATTDSNWGAADTDATIHNEKPVRLQLTLKPRPGVLWAAYYGEQQVKTTRHVHLRALVFDQFAIEEGNDYAKTDVKQREVYTRRECIDDHTLSFDDQGWRKAKTLRSTTFPTGTVQWVFRPADFKKKFRDIENEPIQFGDYLQLTEVPKWDANRTVAGANSRYILGFMAYLFYLSVWVQDRSGRRMWALDRTFLDQSKICKNAYSDWWDPNSTTTPPAAATASTYRAAWPEDPVRQQRRTVACRQWTNEPNWQADQRTRWAFAEGSIGDLLLRHKWEDHDPNSTTLAGTPWPVLDLDEHSKWHTDGRNDLGAPWANLTRQLGAYVGPDTTTRLGNWTWEQDPLWIPCVSRDWHAFYLVPPMGDWDDGAGFYTSVDARGWNSNTNEGGDVAAAPVWSSWCRDMTQPYDSGSGGKKRFAPGTKIDTDVDPNKPPLDANAFDYGRQNDLVHYEDLRGAYSRGPRPAEQPKKVVPVSPYYINLYQYDWVQYRESVPRNQRDKYHTDVPMFRCEVANWWRLKFRSQYVVESEAHFPTDVLGREYLVGLNPEKTRFLSAYEQEKVHYDSGAWTGWKDDYNVGAGLGAFGLTQDLNGNPYPSIFAQTYMPYSVGPSLAQTTSMYMHLVLVGERRAAPI